MPVSENSQQSPRYIWSTDGVMPERRNLCGFFLLTNTVAGLSCCNKPWPPDLSSVCSMVAACARSRLSSRARECSDADWARHKSMPCVTIRTPAIASAVERQDGLHDSCAPTLLVPASMASYAVRKASMEVVETLRRRGPRTRHRRDLFLETPRRGDRVFLSAVLGIPSPRPRSRQVQTQTQE